MLVLLAAIALSQVSGPAEVRLEGAPSIAEMVTAPDMESFGALQERANSALAFLSRLPTDVLRRSLEGYLDACRRWVSGHTRALPPAKFDASKLELITIAEGRASGLGDEDTVHTRFLARSDSQDGVQYVDHWPAWSYATVGFVIAPRVRTLEQIRKMASLVAAGYYDCEGLFVPRALFPGEQYLRDMPSLWTLANHDTPETLAKVNSALLAFEMNSPSDQHKAVVDFAERAVLWAPIYAERGLGRIWDADKLQFLSILRTGKGVLQENSDWIGLDAGGKTIRRLPWAPDPLTYIAGNFLPNTPEMAKVGLALARVGYFDPVPPR